MSRQLWHRSGGADRRRSPRARRFGPGDRAQQPDQNPAEVQMTNRRLTQIAPMRCCTIFGWILGVAGRIMVPFILFAGGVWATKEPSLLGIPWLFFGAGAGFMPLIYALAGFVFGVILAMVYNFVSRLTGGIEYYSDDSN